MNRCYRVFILPCLLAALFSLLSAAAFSAETKTERDIVYGELPGTAAGTTVKLLLDVYEPVGVKGKRPAVVLIHGGGWMFGDKSQYKAAGEALAAKGFTAFSINYRLAPTFHYPAQLDDAQRAVRWIRAHSDKYQIDPARIGALGDSAGGHLVALLGTRDTRDNSDTELAPYSSRVQCVVDLYGPADFTLPAASATSQQIQILTVFFGKTQTEAPALYREGSPAVYVDKASAPFLILHGDMDKLVPIEQSKHLNMLLQAAGVESKLVVMTGEGHGFAKPESLKKTSDLSAAFFVRHLKP